MHNFHIQSPYRHWRYDQRQHDTYYTIHIYTQVTYVCVCDFKITWKTLARAAAAARRPREREASMATCTARASTKGSGQTSLTPRCRLRDDDGPASKSCALLLADELDPMPLLLPRDGDDDDDDEEDDITLEIIMMMTITEMESKWMVSIYSNYYIYI